MIQSFATPSRPFRRLSAGLGAALVACAGLAALLLGAAESEQLWPSISICSGIAGLALILAVRSLGFDWASGPVVYLSYLWLFHFPLALFGVVLSNAILRNVPFHIYQWTLTEHWYKALLITVTCAAAFALGVSIFGGRKSYGLGTRPWTDDHSIATLGVAGTLLGAVLAVSSIVQGGGRHAFQTAYGELYGTVFTGPFAYGVFIFTIGISTAFAGAKRLHFGVLIAAQVSWACVMLLLGARSAGLVGILMAVIVLVKRGVRISRRLAVVSIVTVLWLSAVVGVARQRAVRDNFTGATDASPLGALLEMGGSLNTVSLFENWISSGDDLQLGRGYWLPFERAIGAVIPGVRSDLTTDPRAASEVLLSRASGLGGSVVAEAYYNFGLLAPLVVFVPLGWVIAYLDLSARTPISTAWFAVCFYPLLLEVRGWFISVPVMIALGAVPLALITFHKGRQRSNCTAMPNLRPQRNSW